MWENKSGDRMRKYHIFLIQPRTYQNYMKRQSSLYLLLNRLKNTKKGSSRGSIALYNQICEPFDLERLHDYFMKKYRIPKRKHYYFMNHKKEETYLVELNPSCIIVLSCETIPSIFRILSYYSPYLFVCDFNHGDYFYLEEVLKKN